MRYEPLVFLRHAYALLRASPFASALQDASAAYCFSSDLRGPAIVQVVFFIRHDTCGAPHRA
jgi:hypothetical protein